MGLREQAVEKMYEKLAAMSDEQLHATWKALLRGGLVGEQAPEEPYGDPRDGITMLDWAQAVYGEVSHRFQAPHRTDLAVVEEAVLAVHREHISYDKILELVGYEEEEPTAEELISPTKEASS